MNDTISTYGWILGEGDEVVPDPTPPCMIHRWTQDNELNILISHLIPSDLSPASPPNSLQIRTSRGFPSVFNKNFIFFQINFLKKFEKINRIGWQMSSKGSIVEIKNSIYDKSLYPTKSNIRMFFGRNCNNAYLRFIRNLDGLVLLRLSCNLLAARIFILRKILKYNK